MKGEHGDLDGNVVELRAASFDLGDENLYENACTFLIDVSPVVRLTASWPVAGI